MLCRELLRLLEDGGEFASTTTLNEVDPIEFCRGEFPTKSRHLRNILTRELTLDWVTQLRGCTCCTKHSKNKTKISLIDEPPRYSTIVSR